MVDSGLPNEEASHLQPACLVVRAPRFGANTVQIVWLRPCFSCSCCRFRLEQMPFMEFYHGLRERNWTSPWYKEDATPWRVQFFADSGRFMAPSYPGYRCGQHSQPGSGPDIVGYRVGWVPMPASSEQPTMLSE